MNRLLFILGLALLAAPPAAYAQSPVACYPAFSATAVGPDLTPDRFVSRTDAPAGVTGCALQDIGQSWTGSAWQEDGRGVATYSDDGDLLTLATFDFPSSTPFSRQTLSYNAQGLLAEALSESIPQGGSTIQTEARISLSYDAAGRLVTYLIETPVGTGWAPSARYVFTYGSGPYAESRLLEAWTGTAWEGRQRETYSYTATNLRSQALRETWSGTAWTATARETLAYDAAGRLLSKTTEEAGPAGLGPTTRTTYTYDASGRLATAADETWDGTTWITTLSDAYVYDTAGRVSVRTRSSRTDGVLAPSTRETHTYDAAGRLAGVLTETASGSAWTPGTRETLARDGLGRVTAWTTQTWTGTAWQNSKQRLYEFPMATETAGDPIEALALRLGPNPAASAITLRYTLANPADVTVQVIDMLGRTMAVVAAGAQPAGAHALELDARALAPGRYSVRLMTGGTVATRALTVIR